MRRSDQYALRYFSSSLHTLLCKTEAVVNYETSYLVFSHAAAASECSSNFTGFSLILTVTPNPCLDKTWQVDKLQIDKVNRPLLTHTLAGGKGVNVARVLKTLGCNAVAAGICGGATGKMILQALSKEGIAHDFVRAQGETRTCAAIVNTTDCTQTEINEAGPVLTRSGAAKLFALVDRLLTENNCKWLALCGSLPPGAPDEMYALLTEIAKSHGVQTALDSSGTALIRGAEASPFLLKPNRAEAEYLTGMAIGCRDDAVHAAQIVQERYHIPAVVITLGEEGAVFVWNNKLYVASSPAIRFVSAVASGDSFLAALLCTWMLGEGDESACEALRMALGAGAANAELVGAGLCTREAIVQKAREVMVHCSTLQSYSAYSAQQL